MALTDGSIVHDHVCWSVATITQTRRVSRIRPRDRPPSAVLRPVNVDTDARGDHHGAVFGPYGLMENRFRKFYELPHGVMIRFGRGIVLDDIQATDPASFSHHNQRNRRHFCRADTRCHPRNTGGAVQQDAFGRRAGKYFRSCIVSVQLHQSAVPAGSPLNSSSAYLDRRDSATHCRE